MVDTAIKKNYLSFLKSPKVTNLNSKIKYLDLALFKVKLENRILDEDVFEKVETISIFNQIEQIEDQTFKSFKYLKKLQFNLYSISDFFHKTGTVWMRNLNSLVKVDYKNISEITQEEQFFLVFDWHDEFFKRKTSFQMKTFVCSKIFLMRTMFF
jgi:hypothetical protein